MSAHNLPDGSAAPYVNGGAPRDEPLGAADPDRPESGGERWMVLPGQHPHVGRERSQDPSSLLNDHLDVGPLAPLMDDAAVSDILVNSANRIYVEKAGRLELTPIRFANNAQLLRVIERIAGRVGRRIDENSPLVDARLPDGSRVNAVIPPVAVDGPSLSIRRFGRHALKQEQLVDNLALTESMLQVLQSCIKARLNVIISGGADSGKTTLLNALSASIAEKGARGDD